MSYDSCKHLEVQKILKDTIFRKYHYHSGDRYTMMCKECAKFSDEHYSKVKFSASTLEEILKYLKVHNAKNQSKTAKSYQISGRKNT